MKDLMIRIQPASSDNPAYAMQDFNDEFLTGHNFGTCTSPSNCGTPSTCSSVASCKPSRCQDKPKPKHNTDKISDNIIKLTDLKNMLADMQIKMGSHAAKAVAVL